jgi:AmmeMemoRadiSam system protein A
MRKAPIMNNETALWCMVLLACLPCLACMAQTSTNGTSLSAADKQYLIHLARQTLSWYVKDGVTPSPDEASLSPSLREKRGCFVTLDKRLTGLRGCIGIFERTQPLYRNVISRAIAAATEDPRFPPVRERELRDIKLEISVLTVPKDLPCSSPEDLLAKLRPSVDGVLLTTPYGGSTYLPQVWEQLPHGEEFLDSLCAKHGAPRDTWRTQFKRIRIQTYQAEVFGEEDYGRIVAGPKGAGVGKGGAKILGIAAPKPIAAGPAAAGTSLAPGTVVSPDSDIADR